MYATLMTDQKLEFHEGVPPLDKLQEIVGGYVEVVAIPGLGDMWLNEEGKLDGLPKNHMALWIADEKRAGLIPGDWIAGNVVFTGGADDEGDTIGLTDAAVLWLREFCSSRMVLTIGSHGSEAD